MGVIWETTKIRDNFPRLCYAMPEVTASASSAADGYGAALAVNGDTFDAWKPVSVPATLQLSFTVQKINYIGIDAHTLGTAGATVTPEYWDGSTWVSIPGCTVAPSNDDAILWLINDRATTQVRLSVSGAVGEIGIFKAGVVTEFDQRRANYLGEVGFDARLVEYQENYSATGEKMGRTLRSDGLQFTIGVEYLSEVWADTVWPGIRNHCLGDDGFFWAPRPAQYLSECYWCWTTERPTLERTYPNRAMSRTLTMQVRGYKRA